MSISYYTDANMDNLIFYQVPKVLLIGDRYKKMNPNAVKLYIVLMDRIKLSMKNRWKDEKGRYYVRMSGEKGAELLGFSESTFKRAKKELSKYNLLEEKRDGLTKSNRLFIGRLNYSDDDITKVNNEVDDMIEAEEERAQTVGTSLKGQIELSREVKLTHQEGSKRTTSNNDLNNNKSSNNENNTREESKKKERVKKTESVKQNKTAVVEKSKLESFLKENKIKVNKTTLNKWRSLESDDHIILAAQEALGRSNVRNIVGYISSMLESGYEPCSASKGRVDKLPEYMSNDREIQNTTISREDQIKTLDLLLALGEIDQQEYTQRYEIIE